MYLKFIILMQKISVITVNFNNLNGLKKTIKSVLKQTYLYYEYIVIDGGSTDGSRDYICSHQDNLSYWCSEKDGGIYDAMNKGISHATGDYLLFLNSGDYFVKSNVLSTIFRVSFDEDLLIGRQYFIDSKGHKSSSHRIIKDEINEEFFWSNTLPHQATFIKRDMFVRAGLYDTNYRIVSDWIFWYKAIVHSQASLKMIDTFVSFMEKNGVSGNIDRCREEMAHFLFSQKTVLKESDWIEIMDMAEKSFSYKRAVRNIFSKFLFKLAIYINK